ncbi:HAD family phosphatase [Lysinibacillus irui]|uniref:phosphoserine phosphatase n=1 Tax=Lysinibacillus irui TaxID=2998077 RepID=A0ABU5NG73_9BACI|nr:HAD family phosphatase [Lysinibacillus irui]MEA0554062.1 HAD family phosphatase [Lysinibacillus irui]MEA0974996.1 HAD family phosphatase [Lysinibacillus irui]MEA1041150.1 HAD family phosphatase [Lysinibacillus irui]
MSIINNTAYCFDLDGTITKEEILPLISKEIGLYEEISALTEATIKGIIPFEKSFLLRCRLLMDIPVSKVRKIVTETFLHNEIVDFIQKNKENCFVITGNLDIWISQLVEERLGCSVYSSRAEEHDDTLCKVVKILHKEQAISQIKEKYNRIVAIGDGMGDVSMFQSADIGIAFGGVHAPIESLLEVSNYVVYEEKALCRLLNTL